MARRFITPIGLLARASNPASGTLGDMYYNSSANKIYAYDGSNWTLAAAQGTQGTVGSQGVQGTQGTLGSQGTQGVQGTTGTGTQGAQGTSGSAGGDPTVTVLLFGGM